VSTLNKRCGSDGGWNLLEGKPIFTFFKISEFCAAGLGDLLEGSVWDKVQSTKLSVFRGHVADP